MKLIRLGLLAMAGAAGLCAQLGPRVAADVPFAFEMANQKLPAGSYDIFDIPSPRHLFFRGSGETISGVALVGFNGEPDADGGTEVRLIFNKYGDRYFLSQVSFPHISRQLLKSKNERALVTSTLITAIPEQVVIVARVF